MDRVERARKVIKAHGEKRLADNERRMAEKKGCPISSKIRKNIQWPFRHMSPGDQIEIREKGNVTVKKAIAAAHNYSGIHGDKFKCRTSMDGKSVTIKWLTP
jgi:hypothetical protein